MPPRDTPLPGGGPSLQGSTHAVRSSPTSPKEGQPAGMDGNKRRVVSWGINTGMGR